MSSPVLSPQPSVLPPVIAIVGETASGKSALAMQLAERFNGEIICADSRTVYKGMDIGTAKPSHADQTKIPHHLIDVVLPNEPFNAADFKRLAVAAIDEIHDRNRLPILVGGTGLYVDSVLYDFEFRAPADPTLRAKLQKMTVLELQQALAEKGIPLPHNDKNPRHLVRSLETEGKVPERQPLRGNTLIIGLEIEREQLKKRVQKRIDVMLTAGLLEEVEKLADEYGWETPALQATSYRAFRPYFEQESDLEVAKQRFIWNDLSLAKRQRTWFKRNKDIQWVSDVEQADVLVQKLLQDNA
jgi:tRNA dimethylallyltransferase